MEQLSLRLNLGPRTFPSSPIEFVTHNRVSDRRYVYPFCHRGLAEADGKQGRHPEGMVQVNTAIARKALKRDERSTYPEYCS
jgi:hypothetical protein